MCACSFLIACLQSSNVDLYTRHMWLPVASPLWSHKCMNACNAAMRRSFCSCCLSKIVWCSRGQCLDSRQRSAGAQAEEGGNASRQARLSVACSAKQMMTLSQKAVRGWPGPPQCPGSVQAKACTLCSTLLHQSQKAVVYRLEVVKA